MREPDVAVTPFDDIDQFSFFFLGRGEVTSESDLFHFHYVLSRQGRDERLALTNLKRNPKRKESASLVPALQGRENLNCTFLC